MKLITPALGSIGLSKSLNQKQKPLSSPAPAGMKFYIPADIMLFAGKSTTRPFKLSLLG